MHGLFHSFLSIPRGVAVAGVFLFTSLESALWVGLVVPGEVAAILGGVLAGRGRAPYPEVALAAVSGACIGDSLGYLFGRRLWGARFMKRRRRRWAQARTWLRKRGAFAIFLGRFTPFLRTFMPSAAGAAKMPPRRFLAWDLPTGVLWGTVMTAIGDIGARDFERVLGWTGRVGFFVLAAALLAAYLVWHRLSSPRTK